jgi:hypothetical protein
MCTVDKVRARAGVRDGGVTRDVCELSKRRFERATRAIAMTDAMRATTRGVAAHQGHTLVLAGE